MESQTAYTEYTEGAVLSLVAKSCPTLGDPLDSSPPGSSVYGNLQARLLEWIAISSSRASSRPRDRTRVSWSLALAGRFFTTLPPWKPPRKQQFLVNDKAWGSFSHSCPRMLPEGLVEMQILTPLV